MNVSDPANFGPDTQGAMQMVGPLPENEDPAMITGIAPATTVTVVVVASSVSAGNSSIQSSSASDNTFGGGNYFVCLVCCVFISRLYGNIVP